MAWQLKLPSASLMGAGSISSYYTSDSGPARVPGKAVSDGSRALGAYTHKQHWEEAPASKSMNEYIKKRAELLFPLHTLHPFIILRINSMVVTKQQLKTMAKCKIQHFQKWVLKHS